ncbi:MAG: hypothetical protein ACRD3Q_15075 [Terriglobales bacterium]
MKRIAVICIVTLFASFAIAVASAQQQPERRQEPKTQAAPQHQGGHADQQHQAPAQQPRSAQPSKTVPEQSHRAQPSKTEPQQPERPSSPYGDAYHGGVRPNGGTLGGVHHSGVPQHQGQVRSGFAQSRAHAWNSEHQTWSQRGGYNGYRVPEARVREYWGHSHPFYVYRMPMLFVGGFPRFQYDGYWVTLVDPWPESWPANWYQTDSVYLDNTDDGYYLYDLDRPGPALAVTITF